MITVVTIKPRVSIKPRTSTNTVKERPLFPRGRPHLIATSKSVDAKRAVPPILSHAGIDPAKVLFVESTVARTVADIESMIKPDTEVIIVWNLPALVRYKIQDDQLVKKIMRGLQLLAINRRIAVIGVTGTDDEYSGRERVAGSTMSIHIASTVVFVDPASAPDTITTSLTAPNLAPRTFELPLLPADPTRTRRRG
jgi:hypothetical protein